MKSPVYGLGRNMKHRKTRVHHASAGAVNLKGKKEKLMPCGCCVALNKKKK